MPPTLSEIVNANSTSEIRGLYEGKGYQFENENAFRKQVRVDWKQLREEHMREPKEMPAALQPLEFCVQGVNYRIYGVTHIVSTQQRDILAQYEKAVYQSLQGRANQIFEQHLDAVFPNLVKSTQTLELADHTARRIGVYGNNFKMGIGLGVIIPLLLPLTPVSILLSYLSKSRINFMEKINTSLHSAQEPAQLKIMSLTYTPETVALVHQLPPTMEIERREQDKDGYTSNQAASAYMAEFVRVWKAKESKDLVAGAGHAYEIKYFLERGVKDQKIIDLARKHAWFAERNYFEYDKVLTNMKKQELNAAATGFLAGLTMSTFMAYKAYHLFF